MFTDALVVSIVIILLCVTIQSVASVAIVEFLSFITNKNIRINFILLVLLLHFSAIVLIISFLLQIALWAFIFLWFGEFDNFKTAFYFSAVNYSTLGYGDIVPSSQWRLLGALEAVTGLLMGGFATSVFFSITFKLYESLQSIVKK